MTLNRLRASDPPDDIAATIMRDGYAVVTDVLGTDLFNNLGAAFDRQINLALNNPGGPYGEDPQGWLVHPDGWIEIPRIVEKDPVFETLIDLPFALRVATRVLGPTIELASGGEIDLKLPRSPVSFAPWHTDFSWVPNCPRPSPLCWLWFFYTLGDVSTEEGAVVALPGSHLISESPSSDRHDFPNGCGRPLDGSIPLTGPRGSAFIFHSEMWHMSLPNLSDNTRKLIKMRYKPGWMKQESARQMSATYVSSQTDPIRSQLVGNRPYDKPNWKYGEASSRLDLVTNYPVARFLFD